MTAITDTYDDVPEDILLPTGTYEFRITGYKRDTNKNGNDFWNFTLRPVQVVESSISDDEIGNAKTVFHRVYDTTAAAKMGKQFFAEHVGLETEGVPKNVLADMAVNQIVRAYVVQKQPQEEGKRPWVEVEKFLRRPAA